jgi:hypothetical protein
MAQGVGPEFKPQYCKKKKKKKKEKLIYSYGSWNIGTGELWEAYQLGVSHRSLQRCWIFHTLT